MTYQRYTGRIDDILAENNNKCINLSGLSLSGLAYLLSELLKNNNYTFLVLLPKALEAEDLRSDLSFFSQKNLIKTHLFPSLEVKPFVSQVVSNEFAAARLAGLYSLTNNDNQAKVLLASANAALRLVPDISQKLLSGRENFAQLKLESEVNLVSLREYLVKIGYIMVHQVETVGDFSSRGGILDIFPAGFTKPVRIEFFGDFIESLRTFNVADQCSVKNITSLQILPVSEILYTKDTALKAVKKLEVLAHENNWLNLLWEPIVGRLKNLEYFSDLNFWSPLFSENNISIVEYFKKLNIKNSAVICYEPERFLKTAESSWLNLQNHFGRLAMEERPHLPLEFLYKNYKNILPENSIHKYWQVRSLAFPLEEEKKGHTISWQLPFEANVDLKAVMGRKKNEAQGLLSPLVSRIKRLLNQGLAVNIVLRSNEQKKRLLDMLAEYDLTYKQSENSDGSLNFLIGQLSKGFVAPFLSLAYISEDEIFGSKGRILRKVGHEIKGFSFSQLQDLAVGDFIVHNTHGIGQYLGLVALNLSNGLKGDFLHLSYKGNDKLYVPVERFKAVSKYVGANDRAPGLDRLGGQAWEKLKAKVKEKIKIMAEELLKHYAVREITPGFSFTKRDNLFLEFEAAFEHTETPDQLAAINDVLEDLTKDKPMDRLICGDVGYGKTEVAMRAAFKAVCDKKQVAVLVPTTILAEQHEETFLKRLEPWGVNVASISRFKKPKQQKEILALLKEGKIDVLIGTHKLLQKDVIFKDLGLIVIDEEHRFGVSDKEKLKKIRASADVLSMSATPIPRSLAMSLAGIRDFSTIETPPVDRLAVKTYLFKKDYESICEIIDFELARGGQVYLIHNRVKDIHLLMAKLKSLMPLVNFAVAHGQMNAKDLEASMTSFFDGEIDVWITTTIVESGLDFARANTIILNQADKFGLAQLYQLRGRVGRGDKQAYAYLLVDDPDTLTSDAQKRLKALMDNSDLSSGYQLALHDLQIRGSGNILGAEQSGQANLVGYEMYNQLMEQAISELKGITYEEDWEPEILMSLPSYLPESYVPNTEARVVLYRKLSAAVSIEELLAINLELKDRFGDSPEEVKNLMAMMELKILLKQANVQRLETGVKGLTINFTEKGPKNYEKVMSLITDSKRRIKLSPEGRLFAPQLALKTYSDFEKINSFILELN